MCDEIGTRLRKNGLKCSTVQVSIKDQYFVTIQRQCSQQPPTNIGAEIAGTAYTLLLAEWSLNKPIRMITVSATNLIRDDNGFMQISMFDDTLEQKREKKKESEVVVDKIRERFGSSAILKAAVIDTDIGIYDGDKRKS